MTERKQPATRSHPGGIALPGDRNPLAIGVDGPLPPRGVDLLGRVAHFDGDMRASGHPRAPGVRRRAAPGARGPGGRLPAGRRALAGVEAHRRGSQAPRCPGAGRRIEAQSAAGRGRG